MNDKLILRCTKIQSGVLIFNGWATQRKAKKIHDKIIQFLIEFQMSFATIFAPTA